MVNGLENYSKNELQKWVDNLNAKWNMGLVLVHPVSPQTTLTELRSADGEGIAMGTRREISYALGAYNAAMEDAQKWLDSTRRD